MPPALALIGLANKLPEVILSQRNVALPGVWSCLSRLDKLENAHCSKKLKLLAAGDSFARQNMVRVGFDTGKSDMRVCISNCIHVVIFLRGLTIPSKISIDI